VRFYRNNTCTLREASFATMIPMSTLNSWDKGFDDNMNPIIVPDKRGKTGKVTIDIVKTIIETAHNYQTRKNRIRLKTFTRMLTQEKNITLSSKTVGDILTANNLRSPETRRKRPVFYQKLCQEIPNGLVSIDGSKVKIHINGQVIKLNLEMAVDTNTFAHTAFSIADQETSEEFIKVIKAHCREWGTPIGLVNDSGSANLSAASLNFLDSKNIKSVPSGPANPKGNGTIEGAFSQLKQVIGTIHIDASSPETLAKSVLQTIICVYIKMRNKLSLTNQVKTPTECMKIQVSDKNRDQVKDKLQNKINIKNATGDDQAKLDILYCLIKSMKIKADAASITRAKKTITFYNMEAILESEKAFVKAVNRKKERLSLPYFFGILKRVQQDMDDQAYKKQCQERYNYNQLKKQIKVQQEQKKRTSSTVQDVLNILSSAVKAPVKYLKDVALRRAKEWINELIRSTKYIGILRKKFEEHLIEMTQLDMEQKNRIWEYVAGFLNLKSTGKSVTLFS
jgi:hypothetical protein